jgi:hypothetical protein
MRTGDPFEDGRGASRVAIDVVNVGTVAAGAKGLIGAGVTGAKFGIRATGVGGKASSPGPVVIGETMRRVAAEVADRPPPRATYLNDMPDFAAEGLPPRVVTSRMMAYNRKWILQQLRSGRPIYDIGYDLERSEPSIFYQMERAMIRNYMKLHPEYPGTITP